jgi:hypothetical protein
MIKICFTFLVRKQQEVSSILKCAQAGPVNVTALVTLWDIEIIFDNDSIHFWERAVFLICDFLSAKTGFRAKIPWN